MEDAKKIKKIIEYQAGNFNEVTLRNLRSKPVNGAILQTASQQDGNKLSYLDYSVYKSVYEGGGPFSSFEEAKKIIQLENRLGLADSKNTAKFVVSLLSDGDTLKGMCYSTCSGSGIDRQGDFTDKAMAKLSTVFKSNNNDSNPSKVQHPSKVQLHKDTRLICIKKEETKVKILFFPDHPLRYIFFDGYVTFDSDGKFIGLNKGTLLRKVKNNANAYEVLEGAFKGTSVTASNGNKFLQYEYTINRLSPTGYAAGNVKWDFQNPFPMDNMTNSGVTFLNWNMDSRETKEYIDGEDAFKCDSMHYTLYGNGFDNAILDNLFAVLPK